MSERGKRIYCGCGGRIESVCSRCGATREHELARRARRRERSTKERRADAPLRRLERAARASALPKRKSSNPFARGWTQRVYALHGRECLACSAMGRRTRATQGHHAVPRQTIAKADHLKHLPVQERQALEYDARNGVPLCRDCHMRHEQPGIDDSAKLPRSILPAGVWEWAREHRFEHVLKGAAYR